MREAKAIFHMVCCTVKRDIELSIETNSCRFFFRPGTTEVGGVSNVCVCVCVSLPEHALVFLMPHLDPLLPLLLVELVLVQDSKKENITLHHKNMTPSKTVGHHRLFTVKRVWRSNQKVLCKL